MTLVFVDVNLESMYAPPLFNGMNIAKQVIHGCRFLDVHNALANWSTALADLSVLQRNILLLHGTTSLLLHHALDRVIVLLEGYAFHIRCDIRLVSV